MKAIVYEKYGGPEVLRVADLPKPIPAENEILVRNYAVSVNYGDLAARNFGNLTMREFNMPGPLLFIARLQFGWNTPRQPILGSEFAGVVAAVGDAVSDFQAGDEVFGYTGQSMKTAAEYVCVPADGDVAHKPAGISFAQAAGVPYGALTAWSLLQNVEIRPGQKVLINGASGAIGSAAVQLAKRTGAEVTAVCGAGRTSFVRGLGADEVLDYKRDDFTRNGQRYDLIFDVLGRLSFADCRASLTEHGRMLYASFKGKQLWQMMRTRSGNGRKVICALAAENSGMMPQIAEWIAAGELAAPEPQVFGIDEAAAAHRLLEDGDHVGKVTIDLSAGTVISETTATTAQPTAV